MSHPRPTPVVQAFMANPRPASASAERSRGGGLPVGTDSYNAALLVERKGGILRFSHTFKKWLIWDGCRWAVDKVDRHRTIAQGVIIGGLQEGIRDNDEQMQKAMRAALDAKKIAAMLSLAEPELAITPEQMDVDPYLLTCLNGTIDLRSGELRKHDRNDYITKLVRFDFNPAAQCPLWLATLGRLMGGGPDASDTDLNRAERLIDFLQRAFGYSLTGVTSEKAIFVAYGPGNSGKTTVLNGIRRIIPEHSTLLDPATLMARQESTNSQADLADLQGARFVQTSETEQGQRFAQAKLKRLSQGGGKIKAVRKYENPIEFLETFKIWLDTNTRPDISDADDRALVNRLHPVPFETSIPEGEIDRALPDKLFAEAEGILAWMVEGARRWYASGLQRPTEITAARDQWQADSDQLGRFVDDRCIVGDVLRCPAGALFSAYQAFAERSGERSLTATAFGRKMTVRGFVKEKTSRGLVYLGIGLTADRGQGGGD